MKKLIVAITVCFVNFLNFAWGIEVWAPNIMVPVFNGPDYTSKMSPNPIVEIVAARNGTFSGQVVLFDKSPFTIGSVTVGDLKSADGRNTILGSAFVVRYALPNGSQRDVNTLFPHDKDAKRYKRFNALVNESQEADTIQTVWITLFVPAKALPGTYNGKAAIKSGTTTLSVPVRVKIADWALPDPIDFTISTGIIQSPDSLAIQYKTPLFSDAHFELIGQSMDFLRQVGNKVIFMPTICHTHFGNEESMVRFTREGNSFKPDFTVFDRYLDLYIKRVGKPAVVCLYSWDMFAGGSYFNKNDQENPLGQPIPVSVIENGKVTLVETFKYGTPEAEAMWTPVFTQIRDRLSKRGITEEAIALGIVGDTRPSKQIVDFFANVALYAQWFIHSHSGTLTFHGRPVRYLSHVWGCGNTPNLPETRYYGWARPQHITVFPRYGGKNFMVEPPLWADAPLGTYHTLAEVCTTFNLRGFGRVGLDFWPVLSTPKGPISILNRYPESGKWAQLTVSTATGTLIAPGPKGPVSTTRFENLREGMQEAEARVFIEKAIMAKYPPPKEIKMKIPPDLPSVPDELAQRAVAVLDKRHTVYCTANRGENKKGLEWFGEESGWQQRNEELFNMAGEVARTIKK